MTMLEKIEQVLRISLHLATEREREAAKRAARAVLECLLSPDEEMIEAGLSCTTTYESDGEVTYYRPGNCFTAMIQSILNQGNDGENT